MKEIMRLFWKWGRRIFYVFDIFLRTFFMLKKKEWFSLWFGKEETQVTVRGIKFWIGKGRLEKITNISMIFESNVYGSYSEYEINEDDTIIDVGAHIGSFTLFAAKKAKKGKIYDFEPSEKTYKYLKKNIEENKIKNVQISNLAVGSKKGHLTFYIHDDLPAENSAYNKSEKKVVVKCTTLAEIFEKNRIKKCNLLKIDCEGAEYEILHSSKSALRQVEKIILEYHEPKYFGVDQKYSVEKLAQYLRENGFKVKVQKITYYQGMIFATKK